MKHVASIVAMLLIAGVIRSGEPIKKTALDPAKLVGAWVCISGERAGKKLKLEKDRLESIITIAKDVIILPAGPNQAWKIRYTIDARANPAVIDMMIQDGPVLKGTKAVGIVAADGDRIKLCYVVAQGKKTRRPTKCESTKENQGFLFVLKPAKK